MCAHDAHYRDYVGSFVTSVFGAEERVRRFEEEHDDFRKIMLQVRARAWRCALPYAHPVRHMDVSNAATASCRRWRTGAARVRVPCVCVRVCVCVCVCTYVAVCFF